MFINLRFKYTESCKISNYYTIINLTEYTALNDYVIVYFNTQSKQIADIIQNLRLQFVQFVYYN